MKKITLLATVLLLLFTGTDAFSQNKRVWKGARALHGLERTVLRQATADQALRKIPALHIPPAATKLTTAQIHTLLADNQARIANLRKNHVYEDVWEAMDAPKAYINQDLLGKDLADFYHYDNVPQFRTASGEVGKVYELPVEGIGYAPFGKPAKPLDPKTQVIFYIEGVGTQILDRKLLENPVYFQLVLE